MTLRDLFQDISLHPSILLGYFLAMPLIIKSIGLIADGSKDVTFWGYVYAVLAYMICVPGMLAFTLNLYLFLFERQSIWDTNLVLQLLPILSMIISLIFIKQKIPFEYIPAFGKLTNIITIIFASIGLMWFIDRTRIYAITFVPFQYIVFIFIGLILLIRFAWTKLF
jgi:hypothetical protein